MLFLQMFYVASDFLFYYWVGKKLVSNNWVVDDGHQEEDIDS